MTARRTMRGEAIANFEKGVFERDTLDKEIATLSARLAELQRERDRLTISAETICNLLGWNVLKAEAEVRMRAGNVPLSTLPADPARPAELPFSDRQIDGKNEQGSAAA